METKRTTASVRIMISHNFSNFEISINLENQEGITIADIEAASKDCQSLVNDAVNEYKNLPHLNPKEELKRVENRIQQIRRMVDNSPAKKEEQPVDPEEIAAVEKLPLYKPNAKKAAAKKPTKK